MFRILQAIAASRTARVVVTVGLIALLGGCSTSTPPPAVEPSAGTTGAQLPPGSLLLKGAGATFPFLLYKNWFSAYHDTHPATYVTYEPVGSSEGVRRFLGKNVPAEQLVDFGASDAALSDSQLTEAENNVLMIPATAGCVVLAYNLPAFSGELRLSRKAYSGIFLGEITSWDDPQISQSNPGVTFPKLPIAKVVRQDGSGTTFAFTQNLNAINEKWRSQFGTSMLENWPGNAMRAKGNEGVAGLIDHSTGAIGYVGYEFARRLGLNYASLENKEGNFVRPSDQTCAKALATAELPENLRVFVPDPRGHDSYPIVTFSWILVRKSYSNAQTAEAIVKLIQWSLTDGQRLAPSLGYLALPPEATKKALAALDTVGPHS